MAIVLVVLKVLALILSIWTESNAEKKKKKEAALKEVLNGIKNDDDSQVTAGFDSINRV